MGWAWGAEARKPCSLGTLRPESRPRGIGTGAKQRRGRPADGNCDFRKLECCLGNTRAHPSPRGTLGVEGGLLGPQGGARAHTSQPSHTPTHVNTNTGTHVCTSAHTCTHVHTHRCKQHTTHAHMHAQVYMCKKRTHRCTRVQHMCAQM